MIEEAEFFLEHYEVEHAESTVEGTRSNLRDFSRWLNERELDLEELTSLDVKKYLKQLKDENYSEHTIRNRYQAVSMLFQFLVDETDLNENPVESVDISNFAKRRNKRKLEGEDTRAWLSKDEVNQLVQAAPQPAVRNRCLILFMYYTACRRSEASNVKLDNMNFEERKVEVYAPKIDELVTLRWQPNLDPLLQTWVDEYRGSYLTASRSPYLFVTQKAEQIAPNHISRIIRKAADRAGIQEIHYEDKAGNKRRKVTSHALRHSFAVHWLKPPNKGSLEELKEILAHEDVETTQIYTEIVEDQVDDAYRNHAPTLEYDTVEASTDQICELCGEEDPSLVEHHLSHKPEETMDVCESCHAKIHSGSRYDYLLPDESRADAQDEGWIP